MQLMNSIGMTRKKRSIQKYELNVKHREHVKTKSKPKYKFDESHRVHVNTASSKRYRENENYRKTKLKAAAKKCETNDSFRSKCKATSKESYASTPTKNARKKDAIKKSKNC